MRARFIDAALLIGLVAVAAGIMWTLFNLGGAPRSAALLDATAPPDTAPLGDASAEPGVRPVLPDAAAPNAAAAGAAAGEGIAPGGAAAPPDEAVAPPLGGAAAEPGEGADVPAPPPLLSVPAGTVELTRVGFSFVTGGPGACGVVLEAWTHVAVSRELLDAYGCGASVRVTLADAAGERSAFEGVVGDTMNPQFARTVNVYVGEDEPAFDYGVTTGTITPLD